MKIFLLVFLLVISFVASATVGTSYGTPKMGSDTSWGITDVSNDIWNAFKSDANGFNYSIDYSKAAAISASSTINSYQVKGKNNTLSTSYELVSNYSSGEVPLQSTAMSVEISSSSASDAAAGVGLRTVQVCGITIAGALAVETVSLNGTTSVECATQYLTVLWLKPLTVGTTGYNVGTIYAYFGTATAGVPYDLITPCVFATIASPGFNGNGKFYCPVACTALITDISVQSNGLQYAGASTSEVEFVVWIKPYGGAPYSIFNYVGGANSGTIHCPVNIPLAARDYIWAESKSSFPGDDIAFQATVIVKSN